MPLYARIVALPDRKLTRNGELLLFGMIVSLAILLVPTKMNVMVILNSAQLLPSKSPNSPANAIRKRKTANAANTQSIRIVLARLAQKEVQATFCPPDVLPKRSSLRKRSIARSAATRVIFPRAMAIVRWTPISGCGGDRWTTRRWRLARTSFCS